MEDQVRDLYEQYPYPRRTLAEDQALVLGLSPLENLWVLNHFGFGGKLDFGRPLRIMVAGGGTGDAVILLGDQLRRMGNGGEIVYVDLSQASMAVAQERVQRAGLNNVQYHRGSFLDLPDFGPFDYINASGCLHHLAVPEEGVRALQAKLKPEGVMGVMIYGAAGRTGVYGAQRLLHHLCGHLPLREQIACARRVLPKLPASNWLSQNAAMTYAAHLSDEEIVDRYLHVCDQAYTVPQALSLMAAGDLRVVEFQPSILYRPENYTTDVETMKRLAELSAEHRWEAAEILTGVVSRHSFFAVNAHNPVQAPVLGADVVPRFLGTTGLAIAREIKRSGVLKLNACMAKLSIPMRLSPWLLRSLASVDSQRTVAEIHQHAAKEVPWNAFISGFAVLFEYYNGISVMVLADARGPVLA